ncbi:unnamed protein product [Larinioides sclopetarius]|uniref:Uncharacterized protein n=1 Tax=Larinioides sclopetarius TaxID=280406 RepID=A0AAV1YWL2_9ARAC
MWNSISFQKCIIFISIILLAIQECHSDTAFTCPTRKGIPMPKFPVAYSTDTRLNYRVEGSSVDLRQVASGKKISMEFFAGERHVKYIRTGNQQILLSYQPDALYPTCTVRNVKKDGIELEDADAGPSRILQKMHDSVHGDQSSKFVISSNGVENGVWVKKWEACFSDINASFAFANEIWKNSRISYLHNTDYIVSAEAQMGDVFLVSLVSNFDPKEPSDMEFMPPENVYCEGFTPQTNKKPPTISDYFSYDSELLIYTNGEGVDPIVTHRTVYYDLTASIVRTDFFDVYQEDLDTFSKVSERSMSIIHDFKSGIQYKFNPTTGTCEVDAFLSTVGPISIKLTGKDKMQSGNEFFSLNADKIQYNGRFTTRDYEVDVYTAPLDLYEEKYIFSWYFTTNGTQIASKGEVEENVLVRMVIRSATPGADKEGMVVANFFNFEKGEPGDFIYDLTSCYNETLSKHYVMTFPAKEGLKGNEIRISSLIHQSIQNVAGVSSQRVYMSEVLLNNKYMYARFKLLALPTTLYPNATSNGESTLDEAVAKLKKSVADNTFNISLIIKGTMEYIKPVLDGLNEFSGDLRLETPSTGETYKEGSVIALTIGMLFLGFVLGGVTLNLIVSKKYGVSLCQRKMVTPDPFMNSLGDSSM